MSTALATFARVLPVEAQEPGSTPATATSRSFNIQPQPLQNALTAFGQQAGIQVSVDAAVLKGLSSVGASGSLTPQAAVERLLAGTGLVYSFTAPKTVLVSKPGAQPQGVDAGVEGSTLLETITVTGSGAQMRGSSWEASPDEVYQTAASVAHIGANSITTHGNNLNNALRSVAGVATWENVAQPGTAVNVRGMEGMGRVTSTIDGVRQNYRFVAHAPAGYTYVEPSLLGGIDITKGAITTAGGAGTLAGAVNYRTLTINDVLNADEKIGAQVTTTFGGNAHDDMSITKAGGMRFDMFDNPNGGSLFGAVNFNSSDAYETAEGRTIASSWRDVKSGLFKASFAPNEDHKLDLGFTYYKTDFTANYYDQIVTNKTFTAKYAYTPDSDLIDLRVNAYFNETESQWNGDTTNEHDGRVLTNRAIGIDVSNRSKWDFGNYGLKLDYGFEYYRDDFSGNTQTDANPDGDQGVGGAFVQATLSAGMFELMPGLRYDMYNIKSSGTTGNVPNNYWTVLDSTTGTTTSFTTRPSNTYYNNPGRYTITEYPFVAPWRGDFDVDETRFELSPKVTLSAKPLEWLQVYGTYEESFRPPSINEMFFGGEHGAGVNASFLPNPNMKPETARGWEAGVNILRDGIFTEDDSLRFKAAYYDKDVTNFITTKCFNSTICWFENADGASRLRGFEIDASYDVGWAFAALAYSKNSSDLQFGDGIGGMGEPSRLPDDYTTLTAGLRFLDRKLTLGARMNDVSKGTLIEGGGWETSAYTTYDMFLNYRPSDRLNLFANVTNLTNEQYMPALSQDYGPGRRIFGGMTIKFGDGPLFGESEGWASIFGTPATNGADERKIDWSGAHIGLAGGYSWLDAGTDRALTPSLVTPTETFEIPVQDARGYFGGGFAGYDWQFSKGLVVGIGADFSAGGASMTEKLSYAGNLVGVNDTRRYVEIDSRMDWSASVRGRLGYAVGAYLPYVTAGAAWASYSHAFAFSDARGAAAPANSIPGTIDAGGQRYSGWTIGLGLEKAISERLSIRTEYSFTDLGSKTFGLKQQTRPNGAYSRDSEYAIDIKNHDFRVGVSYRF